MKLHPSNNLQDKLTFCRNQHHLLQHQHKLLHIKNRLRWNHLHFQRKKSYHFPFYDNNHRHIQNKHEIQYNCLILSNQDLQVLFNYLRKSYEVYQANFFLMQVWFRDAIIKQVYYLVYHYFSMVQAWFILLVYLQVFLLNLLNHLIFSFQEVAFFQLFQVFIQVIKHLVLG